MMFYCGREYKITITEQLKETLKDTKKKIFAAIPVIQDQHTIQ